MTKAEAGALICPLLMSGLAAAQAECAFVDGDPFSLAMAEFYAGRGLCATDRCMAWDDIAGVCRHFGK